MSVNLVWRLRLFEMLGFILIDIVNNCIPTDCCVHFLFKVLFFRSRGTGVTRKEGWPTCFVFLNRTLFPLLGFPNSLSSVPQSDLQCRHKRGRKQEEHCSYCYCTTVGKNAHSRKSPTSCLQPPDSSEAAVLIPDWSGSLSSLEHGHKGGG